MKRLKRNEKIGRQVEELVNHRIQGELNKKQRGMWDIETDHNLIEVKSAKLRTIDHKPLTRPGRFFINRRTHEKFLEYAKELLKEPLYIFCVYKLNSKQPKIIMTKTLHWSKIDRILEERPIFTKTEGTRYSLIPHTIIFGDKR